LEAIMRAFLAKKKTWTCVLLLALLAGIAYWQRTPVLAWYHVRQLSNAYPDDREACAQRVADLDEAALPRVLAELRNPDAIVCTNMQYALVLLVKKWGLTDERSTRLLERIHTGFNDFSVAGQDRSLHVMTIMLQQEGPRPLPSRLTDLVKEVVQAAQSKDELRGAALMLAAELVDSVERGQCVDVCRGMAERGLCHSGAGTRIAAVRLLLREPMRAQHDLFAKAVPLLTDKEAPVRRAAVIVLASAIDVVDEEALLPLLHDEDYQVQYLCEMALRKRGLSEDDLKLARMITDKSPAIRVRVLHHVQQMPDLNLGAWLRRLSLDPVASVRAAAVRAAGESADVDFSERLKEMSERDPSETVRLNAQFYLRQRVAHEPRP
jgi:hypothetical protein